MVVYDRREFLAGTIMAAVAAGVGNAAGPPLKLSLSCRTGEGARSGTNVIETTMPFAELLTIAKDAGYDAICLRGSFANTDTTGLYKLYEMSAQIAAAGLTVSHVMPDNAMGINSDWALSTRATHNITPYLTYCEIFKCDMIRLMIWKADEIALAQRAADEARERKIRLVHWSHGNTLFQEPTGALQTLKAINRPNFGFSYEPSQWARLKVPVRQMDVIKTFKPWLWNVHLNNPATQPGPEPALWEEGTVRTDETFEGLYAIGYSGYVTLFSSPAPGLTPRESALKHHQYLKSFTR